MLKGETISPVKDEKETKTNWHTLFKFDKIKSREQLYTTTAP